MSFIPEYIHASAPQLLAKLQTRRSRASRGAKAVVTPGVRPWPPPLQTSRFGGAAMLRASVECGGSAAAFKSGGAALRAVPKRWQSHRTPTPLGKAADYGRFTLSSSSHRAQASSFALRFASLASAASPERMNAWPAPS
jgi:hypothetical protein